jgi:hypothetical protein
LTADSIVDSPAMVETGDSSSANGCVPNSKFRYRPPQNDSIGGICHSEGATRSGLLAEKKIFSNMLIKTPATKESLVASRHEQKILRRPMIVCQIANCGTGLLRMTEKSIFGVNI